ncbi:hypothetical protein PHET_01869 [Paragonimus heterotremus]|uniref:Uncharacterized protein n=1 Tax=Paragonimus heterotremus TaxID=100268 RepID=A0A8J4T2I7_9TREM|nr:hypothetical protein PHET_01869 [Paragonimus heterotremus]
MLNRLCVGMTEQVNYREILRQRLPTRLSTEATLEKTEGESVGYVPYVNRVYFPRRRKQNGWIIVCVEFALVLLALAVAYFVYFHTDQVHMHITRFYAKLGITEAQNLLSQHLLHSAQSQGEIDEAVYWMRKAAKNGDPVANYNLIVAHLKEHTTTEDLTMDDVKRMMKHASDHGVEQAEKFLHDCQVDGSCAWLARKLGEDPGQL